MSRKIKDIKDKDTGELIYPKSHALATYMSDGKTVEEVINSSLLISVPTKVSQLENDSGFITSEAIPSKVSQLENDAQYATPILTLDKSLSISPTFPSNVVIGSDLTLNTNITNPLYYSKFSFAHNKWGLWDGVANTEYRAYNAVKINEATTDKAGFMTAEDKTKLDSIDLTVKQDKIEIVDHGTSDTTFALTPNVLHKWGTVSSLTLTLAAPVDTTVANYYMFEFTSGSTATTLSLPSTVTWASDVSIEANKKYQVSILNNCGVIGGF